MISVIRSGFFLAAACMATWHSASANEASNVASVPAALSPSALLAQGAAQDAYFQTLDDIEAGNGDAATHVVAIITIALWS